MTTVVVAHPVVPVVVAPHPIVVPHSTFVAPHSVMVVEPHTTPARPFVYVSHPVIMGHMNRSESTQLEHPVDRESSNVVCGIFLLIVFACFLGWAATKFDKP